ncbi:MAG: hypothetical protein B6D56_08505 [Candidatus Omnitrophica bacterium 4484_70.1]|nr:MAG: hypothetical protein B6D56_08505 [Candidatus Omnitrophica bacterium 4484_70.1]
MKKLLLITYYFPPEKNVGAVRMKGIAKYLPVFGWEVFVLTPFVPERKEEGFNIVETPLFFKEKIKYLKKGKKFKRGFLYRIPSYIIFLSTLRGIIPIPDRKIEWKFIGSYIGREIIKREKISAIISSSTPVTSHVVAYEIKRNFPEIFWIADFRDLWTQNPYLKYSKLSKKLQKKLEKRIISDADILTTVSPPLAEQLRNFHSKTAFSIPNGFDPEEFDFSIEPDRKFTVTYAGSLYGGKRNPEFLFIAISELLKEKKIKEENIEINFYGPYEPFLELLIRKFKGENIVKYRGNIERKEVLKKLKASQILLLLLWNNPEARGTYSGKLFEYIGAKRPILSIGYKGSVIKELLEETDVGVHCSDVEEVKKVLLEWYKEWKEKKIVSYKGKEVKVNQYSHKIMAGKFAEILERK